MSSKKKGAPAANAEPEDPLANAVEAITYDKAVLFGTTSIELANNVMESLINNVGSYIYE
jgi:hypothetical protein